MGDMYRSYYGKLFSGPTKWLYKISVFSLHVGQQIKKENTGQKKTRFEKEMIVGEKNKIYQPFLSQKRSFSLHYI